jgi:hypothetical protein
LNRRRPPRISRSTKWDPMAAGGSHYVPGMEQPQHLSTRAWLFDGSYRPALIMDVTPSRTPTPEPPMYPLDLVDDPPISDSCSSSVEPETVSAPTLPRPLPLDRFYSPQSSSAITHSGNRRVRHRRVRLAHATGWKGWEKVESNYLHPDDKFVDSVHVFRHRTRSGRCV